MDRLGGEELFGPGDDGRLGLVGMCATEDLEGEFVDDVRHEEVEQTAGELLVLLMEGEFDAIDLVVQGANRDADRRDLIDTLDAEAVVFHARDEGAQQALVLAEERPDALPEGGLGEQRPGGDGEEGGGGHKHGGTHKSGNERGLVKFRHRTVLSPTKGDRVNWV